MNESLFDNPSNSSTQSALAPDWVVRELVHKWGCHERKVRRWHARQAFAVLYSYRERSANQERVEAQRKAALALRLILASADVETPEAELTDTLIEAVSLAPREVLTELCRVAAALIDPPKACATVPDGQTAA